VTVLIVEAVPQGLRGQLTRWFVELRAGIYLGTLDARVRELVWKRVRTQVRKGNAILAFPAANEQGFRVVCHGPSTRTLIDIDGLSLVCRQRG
jgi:CRISPR-associated protein Cas2